MLSPIVRHVARRADDRAEVVIIDMATDLPTAAGAEGVGAYLHMQPEFPMYLMSTTSIAFSAHAAIDN